MTGPGKTPPRTLFDKVWDQHVITSRDDGADLMLIDRHFVHEGSHHAFRKLASRQAVVARAELTFAFADHYVPTRHRDDKASNPGAWTMIDQLGENAAGAGLDYFGLDDPRQGIVHVVAPEQGLTLPGLTIVCGDSHTSTHGAFGAIAFGIGASDVAHVLETQTLWQRRPRRVRVRIEGLLPAGVSAKDLALSMIAMLGADGGKGAALEFAGEAIGALSMEQRLTLCNLTIESGARCGLVAPDMTTVNYLRGRPFAPDGAVFDAASRAWLALASDPGAVFDREVVMDASAVLPTASWGINPEDVLPVTASLPRPEHARDAATADRIRAALDYMGLKAGQRMTDIPVDRVFIGSCTNARLDDLREAAAIVRGRQAIIPGFVSAGSTTVKRQAEAEGLDAVFREAGLEWVDSGCSMCVGMNGDLLRSGERCASTTNRNFKGRQGPGSRTHLMSPAMAAAAAIQGRISDVRELNPLGATR